MHEYYFKIRKNDIEFEFSTSDKEAYEQELYCWVKGFTSQSDQIIKPEVSEKRSGFIDDIRNMVKINEIQAPESNTSTENFDNILEESMQQPKTEVVEKSSNVSNYAEFIQEFNPTEPMDYLVLTGKYILDIENNERFSIKQLNSKIVPLSGMPIDHSLINQALEEGLIRVIPDLTGMSDVTEYSLTEKGEGYFVQ